jgi:hypothetical protein
MYMSVRVHVVSILCVYIVGLLFDFLFRWVKIIIIIKINIIK